MAIIFPNGIRINEVDLDTRRQLSDASPEEADRTLLLGGVGASELVMIKQIVQLPERDLPQL